MLIPLLDDQFHQSGITSNLAGTEYTIAEEGVYRIAYYINITTPAEVYSNLVIGGTDLNLSLVDTGDDISNLSNEVIVNLTTPNTTVSLRLGSGGVAVVADLAVGCGASLIIQRLN